MPNHKDARDAGKKASCLTLSLCRLLSKGSAAADRRGFQTPSSCSSIAFSCLSSASAMQRHEAGPSQG